ncbi:hypothetical protein V8F20_002438 [Naviculisporaceae sp. PSN 640]
MPRQLPWKVHSSGTPKQASGVRQSRATPASSTSRSPAPSGSHATSGRSTPKPHVDTPRRSLARSRGRSPSTSPPPEPIPEEFMREGVDKDDRYRMVEDEFLAVAHDFTRHIHAAEYQRLKGLAKSQNEETIQNISRPVTGEMTDLVKRRHIALETAARQRRALGRKRAVDSDSEEEGGRGRRREGASSLQGLMDSPRKKAVPLTSFSSNLRAEGSPSRRRTDYSQGVRTNNIREEPAPIIGSSSDDDDDDLDSGPRDWLPTRTSRREAPRAFNGTPSSTSRVSTSITKHTTPKPTHQQTPQRPSNTADRGSAETIDIKQEDNEDGDLDDDFFSRIRSRRAEMRRRSAGISRTGGIKAESTPDRDRETFSLDDIPFL